jgi:Chaperone of endosialidase
MADIKISQLPAATTPLAGTEVLPLVQSGETKKVTVADLRATAVTAVTGTAPVVSSGGLTPAISMAAANTSTNGYLTSTDWNTFNGKGSGTVTGVTATSPVVSSGGTAPVISMPAASTSASGYLTSTDWNTFNGKYSTGGALGTPSSGTATNLTGLPLTTGVTGTLPVANGGTGVTTSTGTGSTVLSTSPTLVTPVLGTPTSATLTNATGLPLTTGVTGTLPVANGGTGTTTPALVAGTNVTISGTWPNQTINSSGGGGSGTVTSVAATVPTFLSVTGSPITTSGTLAIAYSGTALPVLNGGTGTTTPALVAGTNVTITGTWPNQTINSGGGSGMVYPGAGIGNSTGTAWGTSYSTTGTGTVVALATSPTFVTPILGTPTSATLTNATGLPLTTGVTGTLPVLNGGTGVTTSTGTGSVVLSTSPTLVTPLLGTPTSGVATNLTGLPLSTGVTGTLPLANGGTGQTTAAAAITALTGTQTSAYYLRSNGTNSVLAALAAADVTGTLAVANGGTGVTTSTGSGSNVLSTSPTLVTPILGTPTSGVATNLTGLPLTTGVTGLLPVANGGTGTSTPALVAGTNVTISGTWPNQTINSSGSGGVSSFSAGTTGFTPSTATTGAVTLAGTLATTNGGTGLTSFTANGIVYASSTSALTTGSGLVFDGTNLGLNVTPSAWGSNYRVIQNAGGAFTQFNGGSIGMGQNFYDSGTAAFKYITTNAATYYYQGGGQHVWQNAPSGTAGTSATFTQAMTLDTGGNLLVGTTSVYGSAKATVSTGATNGIASTHTSAGGYRYLSNALSDGGTYYHIQFNDNGTSHGSITSTGSVTVYNTTSDYRLKNNQVLLTGSGEFIDALKPKIWNWAEDGSMGVGFVAHEFAEVSPSSVSGSKDAVDENGKPIYQAMQASSSEVIANLVAEIQSLRKRLTALEAK